MNEWSIIIEEMKLYRVLLQTSRAKLIALLFLAAAVRMYAQGAPATAGAIWTSAGEGAVSSSSASLANPRWIPDANKVYSLAELIDLAEAHNPETRQAWQAVKAKAALLGVARGALYPTIAVSALANTTRDRVLFSSNFYRQTLGVFQPELHIDALIFDGGSRSAAIDYAKASLLAANYTFNDVHRKVIYETTLAYYRWLNANGQRDAAEANLQNARAVQQEAEERLAHGLATKPDAVEAAAATAQAEYDLQAVLGEEEIAHGNLAVELGLSPETQIRVQKLSDQDSPMEPMRAVDAEIQQALAQRPDLKAFVAHLKSVETEVKQARSSYFPVLTFSGRGGVVRQYGQQEMLTPGYTKGEEWNVDVQMKWTLFDGARREYSHLQARADKAATQASIAHLQDEIANEVWAAYSQVKTAKRQNQAAQAALDATKQSYELALQSYQYGVRNLLDVVSAQKALALANSEHIYAQTQLQIKIANLSFCMGSLIYPASQQTDHP